MFRLLGLNSVKSGMSWGNKGTPTKKGDDALRYYRRCTWLTNTILRVWGCGVHGIIFITLDWFVSSTRKRGGVTLPDSGATAKISLTP